MDIFGNYLVVVIRNLGVYDGVGCFKTSIIKYTNDFSFWQINRLNTRFSKNG